MPKWSPGICGALMYYHGPENVYHYHTLNQTYSLTACVFLTAGKYWIYMVFDQGSYTLPFICFGLYTNLPLQVAFCHGAALA